MNFYNVAEASAPLFVDAYALEGERWVFGSFWGSETVLQEFIARLSLPGSDELGLRGFTLETPAGALHKKITAGQVDRLTKLTGRTPVTTVLGSLCNVWVFDPALQRADRGSGECYVLSGLKDDPTEVRTRLWHAIQDLSQLPLLDHWQDYLVPEFFDRGWIHSLDGEGVAGYRVKLPGDEFEPLVTGAIKSQVLLMSTSNVTHQRNLW